jgi:hypothetical protein
LPAGGTAGQLPVKNSSVDYDVIWAGVPFHASTHEAGGADELSLAASQVVGSAVVDADPRLTDARTPTLHAASHGTAGSDPVSLDPSQVLGTAVIKTDVELVPAGGSAGQVLAKASGTAYDTEWSNIWEDANVIIANQVFG